MTFFLFQSEYDRKLVKKFGLDSIKHFRTPMSTTTKLHKDIYGKNVKQNIYKSMIGSPLYLIVSCLNISFSIGASARYQANPKEWHLTIFNRIVRYVSGTLHYGLWYPFDSSLVIARYSMLTGPKM